MDTTRDFIESLAERFPEDADDLRDALEALQRQKLVRRERLERLNDSQWQRLGLPLGIESLIREELAAVPTEAAAPQGGALDRACGKTDSAPGVAKPSTRVDARCKPVIDDEGEVELEPYEPPQGLRRRGGGGGHLDCEAEDDSSERKGYPSPLDLTPPPDLDILWRQLLEDTLPPDKRPSLQDTWEAAANDDDKYMLLLEYSSYLRKPEITEDDKEDRMKQLEPLMRELGVQSDYNSDESQATLLFWMILGIVVLFLGVIYCTHVRPDHVHDTQAL
mmetsp:Transcript_96772/g.273444  ORF Transcript_96772/g.273444 Transcript_96772/m.273444 type:complete len:277 (-) Transcript_96772:171-1001(-)